MSDARALDYNSMATTYAVHRNASECVISHIAQVMPNRPVGEILEVGCGTADHLLILAGILGARGYGFDNSVRMLEEGAKKNPGLDLQRGDASVHFPYPASKFDLVFSVNVIHYISDPTRFFAEAWRVLRPGGLVVTVTDSETDIRNRTMSCYFPESIEIELGRYHPIAKIEQTMKDTGFEVTWISHTEHEFVMGESQLIKFRNKAFSALQLLPEACFQRGIRRLEQDVRSGSCFSRELYTYVWGSKRDHLEYSGRRGKNRPQP
jgi:SAM-dependent methyltransferase